MGELLEIVFLCSFVSAIADVSSVIGDLLCHVSREEKASFLADLFHLQQLHFNLSDNDVTAFQPQTARATDGTEEDLL